MTNVSFLFCLLYCIGICHYFCDSYIAPWHQVQLVFWGLRINCLWYFLSWFSLSCFLGPGPALKSEVVFFQLSTQFFYPTQHLPRAWPMRTGLGHSLMSYWETQGWLAIHHNWNTAQNSNGTHIFLIGDHSLKTGWWARLLMSFYLSRHVQKMKLNQVLLA